MKTLLIALLFLPVIASASDTWQSGEYRYDGAGNIIGIGNDSYVYDSVSRLSHAVVNTANESYVYDAFGNLVTKTTDGRLETVPPVDSSTNRITTASYDTAGNMTSSGDATYVYDPLNMMVRIDTSYARRRYIYTVDDERIGVQTDPTFTRWTVRDFGGKVLREFRADSINAWTWTEDYIYRDGQLVAAEQPGTSGGLRHFSLDHLGTTRLITNTPAPGETPVAYGRHDFFPFGMEQTPTNQEVVNHSSERPEAMKFTGHQRDFLGDWYTDNSDYLDYMHARYYNPVMGRFLSVDPVLDVKKAGVEPQRWNRYGYVTNNPLTYTDPDGKERQMPFCVQHPAQCSADELSGRAPAGKQVWWTGAAIGGVLVGPAIVAEASFETTLLMMRNPGTVLAAMKLLDALGGNSSNHVNPSGQTGNKLGYLLGNYESSGGKGGLFAGVLGFGEKTLGAAIRSHFAENFTKSELQANGRLAVTGTMTGANGVVRTITTIWQWSQKTKTWDLITGFQAK
jgi:RHS repeat-associated protein